MDYTQNPFGNLTPADFDGLAGNEDKQNKILLQMRLANSLRQQDLPKGQMAGQVYIPPNAVETGLDAYGKVQGLRQGKQLNSQSDALIDAKQRAYTNLQRKLVANQGGQPTTNYADAGDSTYDPTQGDL